MSSPATDMDAANEKLIDRRRVSLMAMRFGTMELVGPRQCDDQLHCHIRLTCQCGVSIDDRDAVLGMNPSPDALILIFHSRLSLQQGFPFENLSQGCPFSSGLSLSKGCPLSQGCLPTEPFGVFPVISTPCRTTTGPVPLQDSEGQAGTFPATVRTWHIVVSEAERTHM